MAAWGPVEFTGAEIAFGLFLFVVVAPFVIAVVGSVVHALVKARQGDELTFLSLFLRWWLWSTLGWLAAWFLAVMVR